MDQPEHLAKWVTKVLTDTLGEQDRAGDAGIMGSRGHVAKMALRATRVIPGNRAQWAATGQKAWRAMMDRVACMVQK